MRSMIFRCLKSPKHRTSTFWILCLLLTVRIAAQPSRYPTPTDCASVNYLATDHYLYGPIAINPKGTRVAYLVSFANVPDDKSELRLFITSTEGNRISTPKLLDTGDHPSQIQWLADGKHLAYLATYGKGKAIYLIDIDTGKRSLLVSSKKLITEYSINENGGTVAFAEADVKQNNVITNHPSALDFEVISFTNQKIVAPLFSSAKIYLVRRHGIHWSARRKVTIISPFTGRRLENLQYYYPSGLYLTLSPNGKTLLFSYQELAPPPLNWQTNHLVQTKHSNGADGVQLLMRYDTVNGQSRLALSSPMTDGKPLWSPDGKRFAVRAESPLNSEWDKQDNVKGLPEPRIHLFVVRDTDQFTQLVADHVYEFPLVWASDQQMLLRVSGERIDRFSESEGRWVPKQNYSIPLNNFNHLSKLDVHKDLVVGDYQNVTTPPELVAFHLGDASSQVVSDLNPQFRNISLAPAIPVKWSLPDGYPLTGVLFLPPDYQKGKRYPLVIQTHSYLGQFACDDGVGHYPSYAPQPLAAIGIMYLIQTYQESADAGEEYRHYPQDLPGRKGYGGLAEAAFYTEVWDAAVKELDKEGLIDPQRVGVTGFSRKGWYAEYMITHGTTHYAAAIATDNVNYSLGERWLAADATRANAWDQMYGGPPSGESLNAWLKYSISFNMDKIHTPLLMEVHGRGMQNDQTTGLHQLAGSYEVFVGLKQLGKPVDLAYYPNLDHVPDDLQYRVDNITRTVDWFRFWLQGYERPEHDAEQQYRRWERLKAERSSE